MPKISLYPGDEVIEAARKANLLKTLHDNEVPVGNACGGKGLCASCKVTVISGAKNLSKPNDTELQLAERNHLQKDERISCQTRILGDIQITTGYWSESDLRSRQTRRKP